MIRIATEKIGKTLVASEDDSKAHIDNIFKSFHQRGIYFIVRLFTIRTQKLILRRLNDLFEIKHTEVVCSCPLHFLYTIA